MTAYRPHWQIEVGDSFTAPGGIVRVMRRAKSGTWVDIVVVGDNGAVWSKRMPLGLPSEWQRLARR